MKRSIMILLILMCTQVVAQEVLTLKDCYDRAIAINPIASEKTTYSDIWQLKDKNLTRGWLPSLDASGNILYNSSVVDMRDVLGELPVPGISNMIKPLPHEQYKITLDINQTIYDGGAIKAARELEKTDLKVNGKLAETDLYKLRSQINTYYFNILLLDRQKELLDNYHNLITKRISSLKSGLNNGVILKSDLDVMESERLKLGQQIAENGIRRNSFVKLLSDITGINIDPGVKPAMPVISPEANGDLSRPELEVFDLRKEQLQAGIQMIRSKKMPKAFGFVTLGFGNPPGNNFFRDEFAPYYIAGAGIRWNLFDWDKAKNERQIISLQQGIISNRKADLIENLNRLLEAKSAEILSLQSLIQTDNEIIALRKRITASAESQYENGVITATEFLGEINAEKQALINYEIHKISLVTARVEYLNISGKDL